MDRSREKSKCVRLVAADAIFVFDRVLTEGSTTARLRLMLWCLRYVDSNPMKISPPPEVEVNSECCTTVLSTLRISAGRYVVESIGASSTFR